MRKALLLHFAALAVLLASSLPGEARSPFDGRWWVHAVAGPGKCTDDIGVGMTITNRRVIYSGLLAAFATGVVTADGKMVLRIGEARVVGRLSATTGRGLWVSPKCKGTWTAIRRRG